MKLSATAEDEKKASTGMTTKPSSAFSGSQEIEWKCRSVNLYERTRLVGRGTFGYFT